MSRPTRTRPSAIRTWLILGRVSNLPTLWSNVLAAWLLAGGGVPSRLFAVLMAGSALYLGGMFLNDACDADFDRRHRNERPIPLGLVPEWQVWVAGAGLLLFGGAALAELGPGTALLAAGLVLAILLYDLTHKWVAFSPVTMALCRVLLFMASGSATEAGLSGEVVWCALALGLYVVGLSTVARRETMPGPLAHWPFAAIVMPFVLAGFLNPPDEWTAPHILVPATLLATWIGRCVMRLGQGTPASARASVSGLLAGIALVDALAVAAPLKPWGAVFPALFVLCLILQRRVPAT